MSSTLIKNIKIINEGESIIGSILITDDIISSIYTTSDDLPKADEIIDGTGKILLPGVIDDQVHFREPGLTHKAEIYTEAKAAVAGGTTSFMEMPNTKPQATTHEVLEEKYNIASNRSIANYSFYIGATNDNLDELLKTDPEKVCGIKVFMGSSTGNMLVDNEDTLAGIFSKAPTIITAHCEDEDTIQANLKTYKDKYGEDVPFEMHHLIRSEEACYKSSSKAAALARKHGARLHILHLTTAKELELLDQNIAIEDRKITGEVCVHHLWFTNEDYKKYGARIKWNPAIKTMSDRDALRKAVANDVLTVVATDHAPHTKEEKEGTYFKAPSGGPLVQHSLVAMLEMAKDGIFTYEQVVNKMCHAPAQLFQVKNRGFIREGYKADLVIIDPESEWTVSSDNIVSKCGWSPFEGQSFSHKVSHTFVNGHLAFNNGIFNENKMGERLTFNR
ncbi:dihydroorotase [Plebeiibacterium sediminum]|uniref:Dihydroorotase n=1 Tax=Plebeiibacterium sediminum TaxID=2992112 RepID=A0AAE3M885_9BACT|nr:dihydroorotase [Plebeiobacterium sediminum]MCW3788380.1 dihydroorotase [Plebeiobacterium sediminum]